MVDTNLPAWLRFNVTGTNLTNLTVNVGSVVFWFASGSWASTNAGGTGPGEYGRLFEAGAYTTNSSFGWWSIFVDPAGANLYFAAQTNDLSSNLTTYISYPISWTTNYFHFVALTYSPTNTALYLDGVLATNGPGVTVYPGADALTNGFYIGSDSNGVYQAHGLFNTVQTYGYPLNSNDVQQLYDWYYPYYIISPYNTTMFAATSPGSTALYGNNLALTPPNISSNLASMFVINSAADIEYELQSKTNLTQANWQSEGFILGSELTNWTPASIAQSGRPTLFLRLRSWVSSDGSGIPDWWELLYFGTTGIDPNAQDAAGDGWTIYQKFQMGLNPNVFYTPPAPSAFSVFYNSLNGTVTGNWQLSKGQVTGYTVTRYDPSTGNQVQFNLSTNTTSFVDSSPITTFIPEDGEPTYTIQAAYSQGSSATTTLTMFNPNTTVSGQLEDGSQGERELLVQGPLPSGTTTLRLIRSDFDWDTYDYTVDTFDLPVSSLNNNTVVLSNAWFTSSLANADEDWYVQTVNSNGGISDATQDGTVQWNYGYQTPVPFYDGRQQLAQNADFILRAANRYPFIYAYADTWDTPNSLGYFYEYPQDYSYAGLYDVTDMVGYDGYYGPYLDQGRPFEENYFFHNFVYSSGDISPSTGQLTTGLGMFDDYFDYPTLPNVPTYVFRATPTNSAFPAILDSTAAQYITYYPQTENGNDGFPSIIGLTGSGGDYAFTNMTYTTNNYGLPYVSILFSYTNGSLQTATLSRGSTISGVRNGGVFWQTATPVLQTVGYYFSQPGFEPLPGDSVFTTTNTSSAGLVAGYGQASVFAGYAKRQLLNGYTNMFSYLGQYFDQAYQIDTNGNVTGNSAGAVSPYGEFVATAVGPVALVTMTNWGENVRGTGVVQVVKLVLDVNHDGIMDTSFNGPDNTSASSPFLFWCNNNFDRWTLDADDGTNYMDDVQVQGCPYTPNTATPDCNYQDMYGNRVIPDTRDLEDYARLWVCGITTNLLSALPAGSTITLNWGDVGSPDWNGNNPTIDLFQASDADGGIEYLTNDTSAANQIDLSQSGYVGRLAPGGSVSLNASFFSGWAGNHFIWCGVTNGSGQLNLIIADTNGNVLAQTSQWIQILDIKQMYERWTVGDNLTNAPATTAYLATEGLPTGASAFQYTQLQVTNTPYILFVHGWNMETWEKDRFAETAFKRLYWQGYQGRFGEFRWPTSYGFTGTFTQLATNPQEKDNFDNSENNAWLSGTGLLSKLNDLNTQYAGQVYVLAHSMGNVVAGEALRLAGSNQVVNIYVASQAAVSAHTYDPTVANYSFSRSIPVFGTTINFNLGPNTPNIYGNWFAENYGGGAGRIVSFYNVNDYALSPSSWQLDQLFKPDLLVAESGSLWNYGYSGSTNDPSPWNHFFKTNTVSTTVNFDIVDSLPNRYEVMSHAAQSYTTALGATPGTLNNIFQTVDLTRVSPSRIWPADPTGNDYIEHFWHSAEFRGDYAPMQGYWSELLGIEAFRLK